MGNRLWLARGLLGIICIFALSAGAFGTAGATGVSKTAIPYLDTGYQYIVVNSGGGDSDFYLPRYDDSGWGTGQAGFGTIFDYCSAGLNTSEFVKTSWLINTDILVRKHFTLPPGANNVAVHVAIDNNVEVWVNGDNVSGPKPADHSGCAARDSFNFSVPDDVVNAGDNVIAVRGIDLGDASYLDLEVTYDAPTYQICPLFDTAKAHKAGSTVPIKLQLCDESGNNKSSSDIVVQATGVKKVSDDAAGRLDDSGSANSPSLDFRYDATLDGYIFNLSTKGLTAGTWKMTFNVDGEEQSNYSAQFVVR